MLIPEVITDPPESVAVPPAEARTPTALLFVPEPVVIATSVAITVELAPMT